MATFLRILDPEPEEKGRSLARQLSALRAGSLADNAFETDGRTFGSIPKSPFAYWVEPEIRNIFERFPPLEGNAGTVKQGLATADDFRFLRLWWEVSPTRLGYSREDSHAGRGWIHFAKGGSYSPYYSDVHLVVNWFGNGAEIRNFDRAYIRNEDYYFRPGLTWPLRSQKGLSVRAYPAGASFGHKGPVVVPKERSLLLPLLGILNSQLFTRLVEAQMAFGSYEVGVLQRTPVPVVDLDRIDSGLVSRSYAVARELKGGNEVTHQFSVPTVLQWGEEPALRANGGVDKAKRELAQELNVLVQQLEDQTADAYGLFGSGTAGGRFAERQPETENAQDAEEFDEDLPEDMARRVGNLLMWAVGVALGRWDVRMVKDESLIPDLQGPFERLPWVAPAGLVGPDGLPATANRIASEAWLHARSNVITVPDSGSFDGLDHITAADYPIDVVWDGVVVDDPDDPDDIVRKVREVLRWIYGPDRAKTIEDEAVEILRGDGRTPRTLRDWFRNQKATDLGENFFDFHISRYSKSRRKAPIYWRLCTSPGRGQSDYGVWLYYPRLTDETLWTVLRRYVGPKLEKEESRLAELRARRDGADGSEAQSLGKEIEEVQDLLEELRWFEAELRKVAESGKYAPDLDDGVVINMAPLHPVVPWKEPEKIWKKLKKGEYDWAKLAMRYWPERVREKCEEDRSLAIAHGLDTGTESE